MKRKHTELRVKPLRKAYQPKYPSWMDENPLENPRAYPYPFSKKMLQVLATTGFSGALLLSTLSGCDAPKKSQQSSLSAGTFDNPFPVSATHLPYMPVSFGTGLPSRMKREDAIDLINSAFQKEGLEMMYDTVVELNGIRVPVNAYNEQYRLGYVWIDYQNHGKGMAKRVAWKRSGRPNQKETKKQYKKLVNDSWDRYLKDPERYIERSIYGKHAAADAYREQLQKVLPAINGEKEQKAFFKQQYYEYLLHSWVLRYTEQATPSGEIVLQIEKRIENSASAVALIKRFESSYSRYNNHRQLGESFEEALNNELTQIKNTENEKKWLKRLEALISLLNVVDSYYLIQEGSPVLTALEKVLRIEDWKARTRHIDAVQQMVDQCLIDFAEMEQLEKLSDQGAAFVAPISSLDDRTIIRNAPMFYSSEDSKRQRDLGREYKAVETEAEKDSIRQLQLEIQRELMQKRQAARDSVQQISLQRLEDDVRQYIQWAKSQQGY